MFVISCILLRDNRGILTLWAESSGNLRQVLFLSAQLRVCTIDTSGYVLNCCVSSAKLQASKGLRLLKDGDA